MILMMSASFAQDISLEGFHRRFQLERNEKGVLVHVRLKNSVNYFTIRPLLQQLKDDLLTMQASLNSMSKTQQEKEINELFLSAGLDERRLSGEERKEFVRLKKSLMNIKNIDIELAFRKLDKKGFWEKVEKLFNEAIRVIDPSIMASPYDPIYFMKKKAAYLVISTVIDTAERIWDEIPILSIASFVLRKSHKMMLEQRYFHHSMLLHYLESIPEDKLSMTKEEVDRVVSSVYAYNIGPTDEQESDFAVEHWLDYGMDKHYKKIRSGNSRIKELQMAGPRYSDVKKLNYAFASAIDGGSKRIYHLQYNAHLFSKRPSLAYDYQNPEKLKRTRAMLNLAGAALGYISMPWYVKNSLWAFIDSCYVEQVRMEGALVAWFESKGETDISRTIFAQRTNPYILE
jgi:hypothetical protein